ncbi:MAG: penicillin-binding protein 2 [Gammaproteobacteria bacterium]|nr:penicillin-binding protein 2 [Gammaproteobacteria bacterium]
MLKTQIKDYLRESQLFLNRAVLSGLIVTICLGALVLQLMKLQIEGHEHYKTLSQDNRVKLVPLPPVRGLIYDRNGVIVAQNLPTYSLEVTPEQVKDMQQTLDELSTLIEINEDELKRFNRLIKQRRRFESIPLKISLTQEEVAKIAVQRHRFPGIDIEAKLLRHYPLASEMAHVLGYVGRINQKELEIIDNSNYAGTSHIGKNGVEKFYEDTLHGKVGMQQVEVNALGRAIRVLEKQQPASGANLVLHIDTELQRIAMQAFGEENGSAVAIDPNTGGVLAMVSKPGYDPNLFVSGISSKDYQALQASEHKPLFNRSLRGQYPPGSTIKPFIALAGLETNTIVPQGRKFCPGYYRLPNHTHRYRDWKKTGHGWMDMDASITQSCDVYFYELGHEMGVNKMHDYLVNFGFGNKTGIDLGGELSGVLPSQEWKKRRYNKPWYPGETLIMAIGQGYYLTTPLQLAAATASFANGGTYHAPRVVDRIENSTSGDLIENIGTVEQNIDIKQLQNWDDIEVAMTNVVEHIRGTAKRIRSDEYRIAGKTGTAQVFTVKQDEEYDETKISKKNRDHALFVAYAPIEDPQIAVAIIVENGGHGGSAAAPIAKKIMDAWLLDEAEPAETGDEQS